MNIDLSMFDEVWDSATPEDLKPAKKSIPDGKYITRIERVEWIQAEADNVPYLSIVLEIDEGDFEGRWLYKRYYCDQGGLKKLRRDIATCELDMPKSLNDFQPSKMLDLYLHVGKQTNERKMDDGTVKRYNNVYLNRRIVRVATTGEAIKPDKIYNDDDVPF
tara:strand:- start:526 stop:1011 length:486 start_codon:yes stop_codon:yes gene_type:complete